MWIFSDVIILIVRVILTWPWPLRCCTLFKVIKAGWLSIVSNSSHLRSIFYDYHHHYCPVMKHNGDSRRKGQMSQIMDSCISHIIYYPYCVWLGNNKTEDHINLLWSHMVIRRHPIVYNAHMAIANFYYYYHYHHPHEGRDKWVNIRRGTKKTVLLLLLNHTKACSRDCHGTFKLAIRSLATVDFNVFFFKLIKCLYLDSLNYHFIRTYRTVSFDSLSVCQWRFIYSDKSMFLSQ